MKVIFFIILLCCLDLHARQSPLERIQANDLQVENLEFDLSIEELLKMLSQCPDCGDVVGNGHGGDVVGNGGGILESKLHFYSQSMSSILSNVISQISRSHPREVVQVVENIKLMVDKKQSATELVFISGKVSDLFFKDNHDQDIRVAKTGFDPLYPIYINVEMLYQLGIKSDASLLGILVHELGHQAGYRSHTKLDEIAAIVEYYYKNTHKSLNALLIDQRRLNIGVINFDTIVADSRIYAEFNHQIKYIKRFDYMELKPICVDKIPGGYQYLNLHWKDFKSFFKKANLNTSQNYLIEGTLEVKCLKPQAEFQNQHVDIEIEVSIENDVVSIEQRLKE